MSDRLVYPELVTAHREQFHERGWQVRAGWALRGHASCDFVERVIEVPLGSTDVDRVIRAHELMHVRVSPHDVNPLAVLPDLPVRALECAEEFRINELLRRLDFQVEALVDGSERIAGMRLGANLAWDEAVYFFLATMGTGAEKEFMKGVRRMAPDWVKPLGMLKRRVLDVTSRISTSEASSTARVAAPGGTSSDLPEGFERFTVPVARLLAQVADASAPRGADQLRQFRRSLEPGGQRPPTGRFATMVFDETLNYEHTRVGRPSRRPRADVSGTAMKYPNRLLVDPHRRAFARSAGAAGGVVLVDQSGSMDIDHSELDRLLLRTPGATVLGYSHRPGSSKEQPNAWILASPGRRVLAPPSGNVGNGVDGPVLRWALARRRSRERVVWVTDGQVTDSNDHPDIKLAMQCAQLVRDHRISLVRTLSEADSVLRGSGNRESHFAFGRVGRALGELASR